MVETESLAESLERGYTLPATWYTDPAILRLEQERIFRRAWQYVGHAGQVASLGDYFASRAGDVPIVVARDRSGELRAFVNVCRHRGSVVVEGAGHRETLQCGYHAWTYGLDGTLRSAPRADREPGFDLSELSLVPVQVDTWGPFVFVNPDLEAPPLGDALGELPAIVERSGIDLCALQFRERIEYELQANWKVAVENFLECYHCPVAHAAFSEFVDVAPDSYALEAHGSFFSQLAHLRKKGRRDPYDPQGEVTESQFHLLWPSFKLNILPGRANVSAGPVLPLDPERTAGFLDYFFAPDVPDELAREMIAFDDQVGREDKLLVESVQRGLRSGVVPQGRLLRGSEHLIHDFQKLVLQALSA